MKKMIVLILSFVGLSCLSFGNTFEGTCFKQVDTTRGNLDWRPSCACCIQEGNNCIVVECGSGVTGEITKVSGGYNYSIFWGDVTLRVKQPSGIWEEIIRPAQNYQFSFVESIRMSECSEYPELVGRVISLNGLSTDSNGFVTVFIPD